MHVEHLIVVSRDAWVDPDELADLLHSYSRDMYDYFVFIEQVGVEDAAEFIREVLKRHGELLNEVGRLTVGEAVKKSPGEVLELVTLTHGWLEWFTPMVWRCTVREGGLSSVEPLDVDEVRELLNSIQGGEAGGYRFLIFDSHC